MGESKNVDTVDTTDTVDTVETSVNDYNLKQNQTKSRIVAHKIIQVEFFLSFS